MLLGWPYRAMAAGIAKAQGANQIISSDIVDAKLEIAKTMGATHHGELRQGGPGRGGHGSNRRAQGRCGYRLLGKRHSHCRRTEVPRVGRYHGPCGPPDKPVALDLVDGIIYREATLIGVTGRRMYDTWFECEKLLKSGKIDLAPIVGGKYDMKDYEKAFKAVKDGVPGKMLLIP